MAEINNNYTNKNITFGKTVERNVQKDIPVQPQEFEAKPVADKYSPDEVGGRSQVQCSRCGADITSSVNEAVALAKNNLGLLLASDKIFKSIYEGLLAEGVSETKAVEKALACEEEFMKIGLACS